ncbi:uncharacterized protein LOC141652007 [Silene latifolia]|uniref:uncharacterized protein LOC141652007 n=1 Tax=Silene latifolia TaxID=37657 RepID=UPI003D782DB7
MKKLKSTMIRVDWSRLPDDLLRRIVENYLTTVKDYVIFSCVCRSWYSIARDLDKSELRKKWSRQMPLLMLTDGNTDIYDTKTKCRSFYVYKSLNTYDIRRFNVKDYVKGYDFETKQYIHSDEDDEDTDNDNNNGEDRNASRCLLNLSGGMNKCYKANLPEAYGRSCWGTRYGWIVTLGCDRQMNLLNPLTKATLPLPSQKTFPFPWKGASGKTIRWTFMERAVLLLVPRDNGCHSHISRDSPCSATDYDDSIWLVVALHHDKLASIAKPGDSSWTPILRPSRSDSNFHYLEDVTYCSHLKSLLFVDNNMKVFICDLSDIEHPQVLIPYFKGRKI